LDAPYILLTLEGWRASQQKHVMVMLFSTFYECKLLVLKQKMCVPLDKASFYTSSALSFNTLLKSKCVPLLRQKCLGLRNIPPRIFLAPSDFFSVFSLNSRVSAFFFNEALFRDLEKKENEKKKKIPLSLPIFHSEPVTQT